MGIPKFFKWLTRRYPLILQNIKYEEDCPPSDNLYLDLNSIVHNCIHGNDKQRHERISRLEDLEEVWADIMRAIDEIVHTVKPLKLIFLAVDGVAPRAKMNQQRARRFRSAKDSQNLKNQLLAQGKEVPDLFDSNQISPGTKFMQELGQQLQWFVKFKINTDPLYQQCESVVLSDSTVPGEGEHKMLDYIRNLRLKKDYNPNTRHCFYGSDADLIMLSLLTHEPHFYIIREEHIVKKLKQGGVQRIDIQRTTNLQLIHISILREYFMLEYRPIQQKMKMKFDIERIIDDFVFFCFFIGNDFIPSLSALDISEGSLDHLINFYKQCLPQMTDYLTHNGQIYWDRAEPFIAVLGKYEHQVFINRVKTLDQQYYNSKNIMTFDDSLKHQQSHMSQQSKAQKLQSQLKQKIRSKKQDKCKKLFLSNKSKNYKKFLLLRKFQEDEKILNEEEKQKQLQLFNKYNKLREQQYQKDNKMIVQPESLENLESIQEQIYNTVQDIREEFFSDLNPDDIPNCEVSDLSESEILESEIQIELNEDSSNIESKIKFQLEQSNKYIEENHNFMKDFINTYKEDASEAKRSYYLQKLKFDVKDTKGKKDLHKMLYRYLEGLQWVLFYYYRGAQHWRWYYPYHYAPMISDLGASIVRDFLDGQNTISNFKTDENCNENPRPYTPFQQLLCILPENSLKQFLPISYLQLAQGELKQYFVQDFDIDLNGRTLPWEASILIPFVDENLFLEAENNLLSSGIKFTETEIDRNTIQFDYPVYYFDKQEQNINILKSTLKGMNELKGDKSKFKYCNDYEKVGTSSFSSQLLKGVTTPLAGFPSLYWLNVNDLEPRDVCISKVLLKQFLVKIPRCIEDTSGKDFENWIFKFINSKNQELYIDFPRQIEAIALQFEDPFSIYKINYDENLGKQVVNKFRQNKSEEEFKHFAKVQRAKYEKDGIYLGEEINTFVTLEKLNNLEYDENLDQVYKCYTEQELMIPLNLVMRKRETNHHLNVNERFQAPHGRLKLHQQAIIFSTGLFGVIGTVKHKNIKENVVKIQIDKQSEERKLHNPFLAENFLKKQFQTDQNPYDQIKSEPTQQDPNIQQKQENTQFYGDKEIEVYLNLPQGCINKLTGSFLIAFDEINKEDRQVVDIGLNLKNFTKKVHVAEYVRFIAPNKASNTIYDDFQHNQAARCSKHVRKHWEYSQECFEIIEQYIKLFPEILNAINSNQQSNKAMNSLFDLYPDMAKKEKSLYIEKLRKILDWIESLPISKLPYVEMGFDALNSQVVQKLIDHKQYVLNNYGTIELDVQKQEILPTYMVYQEMFPYWFSPYINKQTVNDFRVGNRVMNINSTLRQYIPFGARGTVIGKTEEFIIVMLDDQFLHGTDMYGHCQNYKGAKIYPLYLLNLSKSFAGIAQTNKNLLKQFQEKPLKGMPYYQESQELKVAEQTINNREIHLQEKYQNTIPLFSNSISQSQEEEKIKTIPLNQIDIESNQIVNKKQETKQFIYKKKEVQTSNEDFKVKVEEQKSESNIEKIIEEVKQKQINDVEQSQQNTLEQQILQELQGVEESKEQIEENQQIQGTFPKIIFKPLPELKVLTSNN